MGILLTISTSYHGKHWSDCKANYFTAILEIIRVLCIATHGAAKLIPNERTFNIYFVR